MASTVLTNWGRFPRALKMRTDVTLGARIVQEGVTALPVFQIPSDATEFRITLDATQHLNTGVTVIVKIEASVDNEATWQLLVNAIRQGGVVTGDHGVPDTAFNIATALPPQVGQTLRKMRLTVTAINGSFNTAGGTVALV